MSFDHDDVLAIAAGWLDQGHKVAIATVVTTWGSSPRPAGSRLAVDATGRIVGSVSGGCIEGAVVRRALEVIADGEPCTMEFGIADEDAWAVGLACGGRVSLFVEAITP